MPVSEIGTRRFFGDEAFFCSLPKNSDSGYCTGWEVARAGWTLEGWRAISGRHTSSSCDERIENHSRVGPPVRLDLI